MHMAQKAGLDVFEVIDLDPYGTAIPFLSSTFNALGNDGLLCVTCTDMRVLAGKDHHKCFYMYGSVRSRGIECFQENALRLSIATFNRIANEQCKGVEVLAAFQSEFYLRAYLRVTNKKSACWDSMSKTGMQFVCPSCFNTYMHNFGGLKEGTTNQYKSNKFKCLPTSNCDVCGHNYELNGPVWTGKLYNAKFVQKLLDNLTQLERQDSKETAGDLDAELATINIVSKKKIRGLLEGILEESPLGHEAITYNIHPLFKLTHTKEPSKEQIIAAFWNAGYKHCQSYCHAKGFKTDAPRSFLYDIVRQWKRIVNNREGIEDLFKYVHEGSPGYKILEKEMTHKIDLENIPTQLKKDLHNKGARFLPNPEKNWGPKAGADIHREYSEKQHELATKLGIASHQNRFPGDPDQWQEKICSELEQDLERSKEDSFQQEVSGFKAKITKDSRKASANSKSSKGEMNLRVKEGIFVPINKHLVKKDAN
jgi:tRNA (guanine26-N2/guanine27-N2)-dimethyltransferase